MTIKHIQCNIFNSDAEVICHLMNDKYEMESDIAKQIKERYPQVFARYETFYEAYHNFNGLGQIDIAHIDSSRIICALCAQKDNKDNGLRYTIYTDLEACMRTVKKYHPNHIIAIPYPMDCYRSDAVLNKVNQIIEEVFADYPGTVLICEYNCI